MRQIKEIIIHCSATPEGRKTSVSEIRAWHKARGFNDIGYHYVIALDGVLFDGRPIEKMGAHCKGHNRNSVGICYVGGVDKNMKPKDTRTEAQKDTLIKLVTELKQVFPTASIHGHREFARKACPSFDVSQEF